MHQLMFIIGAVTGNTFFALKIVLIKRLKQSVLRLARPF